MTDKDRLLKARRDIMQDIRDNISDKDIIKTYLKGVVSRRYKEVVSRADINIPVVWGEGGAQTARIKEYNKSGIEFIHMPSYLLN